LISDSLLLLNNLHGALIVVCSLLLCDCTTTKSLIVSACLPVDTHIPNAVMINIKAATCEHARKK
jgi:hypothetical protein